MHLVCAQCSLVSLHSPSLPFNPTKRKVHTNGLNIWCTGPRYMVAIFLPTLQTVLVFRVSWKASSICIYTPCTTKIYSLLNMCENLWPGMYILATCNNKFHHFPHLFIIHIMNKKKRKHIVCIEIRYRWNTFEKIIFFSFLLY